MIKIGVADYGLNVWYGKLYDYRQRLEMLKDLGYDGIERLNVSNQAEAIEVMADAKQMGMDFATCETADVRDSIRFSAALGMKYVWNMVTWRDQMRQDLSVYIRQSNYQIAAAKTYGLKTALHNHMGVVETPDMVREYMDACPEGSLLLDTAHLAAAGGNALEFAQKYYDRLAAVHVKDFVYKDKNAAIWPDQLRFCELGAGEMGDMNKQVLCFLKEKGYDGWIFVEHDTHLQDPAIDLKISRDYIRSCGL